MDKMVWFPIQRFASLDEMKTDEYKYWQTRPAHERMTATSDLSTETFRMKDHNIDVSNFQRTLIRLER